MEYVQLQGRSSGLYFGKYQRKTRSFAIMGIVLVTHVAIIVLVLNDKASHQKQLPDRMFQLIKIVPEQESHSTEPTIPKVPELHSITVVAPPIQFAEPKNSLSNSPSSESADDSSGQYTGVFDPKMRQKLLDSQKINRPRTQEKSKTWTAIDGRTYIEMGDGICMVSMAKVDSRDRANNWGYTTCGKNDSEKAMDRVMADFESRKAPLGKLKSSP